VIGFALVAAAYAVSAELSWHGLSSGPDFGFPPAGVDAAVLLLTARRHWPVVIAAIVAGGAAVDWQDHLMIAAGLGSVTANAVEPVVGASCVLWLCRGRRPDLGAHGDLARFVAGAVVMGPLAGALIGASANWLSKGGWWPGLALQWWSGDAIAVVVVGGGLLLWSQRRAMLSARWAELALLALVVAAGTVLTFPFGALPFLLFLPILAWAAFRLGDLGVLLAGTAFAAAAAYMTAAVHSGLPNPGPSSAASVAVTQAYIAITVLVGWVLAQEVTGRISAVQDRDCARAQRQVAVAGRMAAELGAVLADAANVGSVGQQVSAAVRAQVRAEHVVINILAPDGRRFERLAGDGARAQAAAMAVAWTIDSDAPGPRAVRDRAAVYLTDRAAPGSGFADASPVSEALGLRSAAALPLLTEAGVVGYLGVGWTEPHETTAAEREFLRCIAEMAGRALTRAWLRQEEQEIVELLRRAVRPAMPGAVPGLDVGVRYRQTGITRQIGGDWYDTLTLPGGRTYLAVGDVIGHGPTAAEDMTQLRSAGRAMAIAGHQPADILSKLARVSEWATNGKYATMAAAIVEPDVSRLTYATAGHPPILFRRAQTGTVEIPPDAAGPPLCVAGEDAYPCYTQGQAGLDVGDIMLMYTDGLIERRGEDPYEGIARLACQLEAWRPGPPLGDLCDQLVGPIDGQPQQDDMCVLAVCRTP
jgi:integral membrane sensor domain MASE1